MPDEIIADICLDCEDLGCDLEDQLAEHDTVEQEPVLNAAPEDLGLVRRVGPRSARVA